MTDKEADVARSALIIVDMQNDFVHPEGGFAYRARENPEDKIDMPFLMDTKMRWRRCTAMPTRPNSRPCSGLLRR